MLEVCGIFHPYKALVDAHRFGLSSKLQAAQAVTAQTNAAP